MTVFVLRICTLATLLFQQFSPPLTPPVSSGFSRSEGLFCFTRPNQREADLSTTWCFVHDRTTFSLSNEADPRTWK